jgi:hypothetical protein
VSIQQVNIGSAPDDGSGDALRTAFEKLNQNDAALDTTASAALTTAWAGTNVGNQAFSIAVAGTNAAAAAAATANAAFSVAISGTADVQATGAITGLTGGGATNLDGIATVSLAVGLMRAIRTGTRTTHLYQLVADAAAEDSPNIILPDDYNASTNAKFWLLQAIRANSVTADNVTTSGVTAAGVYGLTDPLDDDQATNKLYVDTADGANAAAASTAQSSANTAISAAAVADLHAGQAFSIAVAGTNAAATADSHALTALQTAWTGTGAAASADSHAITALQTAWTGTSAAAAASALATSGSNVAWEALVIAQQGTVTHATVAYGGTIAFDMAGAAYQSCTVTGNPYVTVINQLAPTTSKIQAVSARLVGDTSSHLITLNDFVWYGTQPSNPFTLPANKSALLSFTSYGANANQVAAVYVAQV